MDSILLVCNILLPQLTFKAADNVAYAAYSDRSLSLSLSLSVCRVLYCGKTVLDRTIVCIEVE